MDRMSPQDASFLHIEDDVSHMHIGSIAISPSDSHWALVSKTHHCMVDGVSGTDLLTVVRDREPEPVRAAASDWEPESSPSNTRLVAQAVAARLVSPYEMIRSTRSAT